MFKETYSAFFRVDRGGLGELKSHSDPPKIFTPSRLSTISKLIPTWVEKWTFPKTDFENFFFERTGLIYPERSCKKPKIFTGHESVENPDLNYSTLTGHLKIFNGFFYDIFYE